MVTGSPQQSATVAGTLKKPRWHELRVAYPRLAYSLVFSIFALLCINVLLTYYSYHARQDELALRASLERVQVTHDQALTATEGNLAANVGAQARRATLAARAMHLSIDTGKGTMYLLRDGAVLREMAVRLPKPAGTADPLRSPRGRRFVVRVVDETYPWEVPRSVFQQRGLPIPADRNVRGALGPVAVILDGNAVIYSRPKSGPLSDREYVLPGSVRAQADDLRAVRAVLKPGMAIYLY
ncbi:hypothetical protein [Geomesophilobacter sediminis]|uniref:Uncharacterized protein n=1 Tax=Geomesophilobacter sediminis TaxID=2798584 RepID=A0A8J7LV62_9BACT|nr:hypothetical protein [Geomesophilobacter sediminis]MBJ6724585.1 hypothetical protein [Geomesophilobacter sediminis]